MAGIIKRCAEQSPISAQVASRSAAIIRSNLDGRLDRAMETTLRCPKCGVDIPLSDAFRKEIEADFLAAEHERHEKELADATAAAGLAAAQKAARDFASREATLKTERDEEKERNARLLTQLEDMTGEMRALRRKDEERELAYKKQIAAEEERIRVETRKSVTDEYLLKEREKDKRLTDALQQIEQLKAKMQQGSQQIQGEVMELELEELLRQEFKGRRHHRGEEGSTRR